MYFPKLCSFDLETTGVDVTKDRIVTAACIDIDLHTYQTTDHTWLADPGIPIPDQASNVHGVTTAYAQQHGRPHDEVLREVIEHIYEQWSQGAALVVYNASYDLSMLKALEPSFEIRGAVIDPLVIDKGVDRYRKGGRKLVTVAQHYGVSFDETDAHDATADCYASARIAWKMLAGGVIPCTTIDELMQQQAEWKLEQWTSLRDWLAKKGEQISGDPGWPFQHCVL